MRMRRDLRFSSFLLKAVASTTMAMALLSCEDNSEVSIASNEHPVVYGQDDRQDLYAYQGDSQWVERARVSSAAMIHVDDIRIMPDGAVQLLAPTLQEYAELCSDQRFLNQPTAAFCSGTLIDDDLVLTAGHCVESQEVCSATRFVFNYAMADEANLTPIVEDDVFSCEEVVVAQATSADYAVIRLDRAATPRFVSAPVRGDGGAVPVDSRLVVIGCPTGLPTKIDDGGFVRDARGSELDYFVATTDSFHGSSGSGVYDQDGRELVGVFVRGETDYVRTAGDCFVVNECAEDDCRGQDSTYVHRAIEALCRVEPAAAPCGASPECLSDADCDDGVSCSEDSCVDGNCAHIPDASLCDDGIECTSDRCDLVAGGCSHEPQPAGFPCDDGVCDGAGACVAESPWFTGTVSEEYPHATHPIGELAVDSEIRAILSCPRGSGDVDLMLQACHRDQDPCTRWRTVRRSKTQSCVERIAYRVRPAVADRSFRWQVAWASGPAATYTLAPPLPEECTDDTDCPMSQVCVMAVCLSPCIEQVDCPEGQQCIFGFCSPEDLPPPVPAICTVDEDCPENASCVFSVCVSDNAPIPGFCISDVDCAAGLICSFGICLPF